MRVMGMVVVTAAPTDKKLSAILKKSSNGALSILNAQTQQASFYGKIPDLIFVTENEFKHIECDYAIFLVRSKNCIPETFHCKNAIAVVNSSDRNLLEMVAQRRIKALTCGLSSVDTLTLSSLTSDSAAISLQRQVQAFDGSTVEPFELPVSFTSHFEPFSLLYCAAVFCLLGKDNPLSGCGLWKL